MKSSLRPSDEVDVIIDDDAMSTAASGSGDWSACPESEASHSEVCEPPAPIDEELVKILSEAIQDLGLDWSPPRATSQEQVGHAVSAVGPPGFKVGDLVVLALPLFGPSPSRGIANALLCRQSRTLGLYYAATLQKSSCSTPLSVHTWVEICTIASIEAMPHHEPHRG